MSEQTCRILIASILRVNFKKNPKIRKNLLIRLSESERMINFLLMVFFFFNSEHEVNSIFP